MTPTIPAGTVAGRTVRRFRIDGVGYAIEGNVAEVSTRRRSRSTSAWLVAQGIATAINFVMLRTVVFRDRPAT